MAEFINGTEINLALEKMIPKTSAIQQGRNHMEEQV